ncbi:PAS domain-containing protein [Mesorhizobium australicum]|uniref:PAS domain-containing protein n=1 Tax=Mesorhizobium australicum TaxID=536018 RepID=A0ACC6T139_9HYPH
MMRVWLHRPPILYLGLFFAAYVLGCGFAQSLAIVPGTGISIWPPSGLFIATLVLTSLYSWPWWVLVGCLAELFSNFLWFHSPLPAAFLMYTGNALEAVTGAWLVNRTCNRPVRLETLREVLAFVALAAGIAPTVSATVGSATLQWFGMQSQTFAAAWPLWWIGDATGVLIVAPLALVVLQNWRSNAQLSAARWLEACVLGLIFLGVAALSLSGYLPFSYIIMPPLLWAAVRFEFKGAAVTLTLLALITAVFTVSGASQFAGDPGAQKHNQIMLQLFLAISAFSALIVAAISRQHQLAMLTLRESLQALSNRERELSLIVEMVPAHIARMAPDGEPTFFSKRTADYIGLDEVGAWDKPGMSRLATMIGAAVHPDDGPVMREVLSHALATGEPYSIRFRLRRTDGAYRWREGRAEPLRDQTGTIVQWYAATVDIDDQVKAEEALRRSEQQLQEMIDAVPVRIWSATPEGGIVYFNKRYQDHFRSVVPDFETIDKARIENLLQELVHPEDAPEVERTLRSCFETGGPSAMRFRWREKDGAYRWAECRVGPRRDQDGTIAQWYGVSLDIDDEVRAQEALRDRERELSQLVDMVPVQIRRMKPDGEPTFFNKRLLDFFGLDDIAVLDKPGISRLSAIIQTLVHPDDAASLLETARHSFATGEPFSVKYRMRRADGAYRWVDGRGEPLRDQSGAIVQWYVISLDIDDEMRAQEALRDNERELSQLVDMVPSHVWRLRPDGEPVFFNKQMVDFLGLKVADTDRPGVSRLQALIETVHADDAPRFKETIHHSLATGESFAMQYRLRRADGIYRWMSGRAEPMRDDSGRIVQWFGLGHDIDGQMRLYSAIEEREAKIRRLIDSDIIGIVIWDLDGRLIDANNAFLGMLQYDREDLEAGLRWFDMTPPEWQDVHARYEAEELKATGKMQAREKEFFRKDGSRVTVLIGAACFEGQSTQGVAYILDLTERKSAEAALRDREHELARLVDTVPVQLWSVAPGGDPAYINKTMTDYIGLKLEDFDAAGGLPSAIQTIVHPDDRAGLLQGLTQSFESGERFELKFRNRRWDGAYRWTEGHADPLRDESGRIIRWYGANVDIHDHVISQEALLERERFLWQLVETLPAMIDCAAPDGEPVYRSQQLREFLGYQLETLDGTGKSRLTGTLDAGVHPDDVEGVKQKYAHSLSTGEPYARRHRLRRFDGEYRWVETRAAPMRNVEGAIVQWNVICLDIDGEVRAQEQLRLAQENLARQSQAASLAELSASIAHEVNQPLAAVVANSHACQRWLTAEPPNLERAQKILQRVIRDANSAADVVSHIRALFRQSVGTGSTTTLSGVIAEARDLMAEEAARRRVNMSIDVESNLPPVALGRIEIQQVLVNLIRNGMDAMDSVPGDRVLGIRVHRTGDVVQTEISDRGRGVEFPERIFEPFFTTKEQGMGMGLAICRSIVESHGGRLWAEANEPRGAKFIFTLPAETKTPS